jgi:hypothetical protein
VEQIIGADRAEIRNNGRSSFLARPSGMGLKRECS